MSPDGIEKAARLLHEARRDGRLLPAMPAALAPATLEEAYAIQTRVVELSGDAIAGWFLGCTNPAIQRQLGLSSPYAGRLLASAVHRSPAALQIPGELPAVLEVEFAFRLARDLPSRPQAWTQAEVGEAVASVHPAIEVVIAHFADWTRQPILDLIADNGTDGALVIGKGISDWRGIDLATLPVSLRVDGRLEREANGAAVLDGPLSAMTWLANDRAARGDGLRAGDLHNTGSCTAMYFAHRGERAVADFGPLGWVELTLR